MAGLIYVKKNVKLAAGETINISAIKPAGLIILSEGNRGAIFAYALTYSGKGSIDTLFADKDLQFQANGTGSNIINLKLEDDTVLLTNQYNTQRTISVSIL